MNEEPKIKDRVVSISYRPADKEAYDAIVKMKAISKQTGRSFSFLVIESMKESLIRIGNSRKINGPRQV